MVIQKEGKRSKQQMTTKRQSTTVWSSPMNQPNTDDEIDALLNIVQQELPIGSFQWESVAGMYSEMFPLYPQTTRSIHNKSNELKDAKMPTGDPNIPYVIKHAKLIAKMILDDCETAVMVCQNKEASLPRNRNNNHLMI